MNARKQWRLVGTRVGARHALLVGAALFLAAVPRASAQSLHHWTEIDDRGTAVDWNTLIHTDVASPNPTLTVWARTVQENDTISAQVAVRCTPRHAAVIEVRRPHPNGQTETTGPIALSVLTWQDPPPLSYLASVSRAVCARTREERPRPC
jgi:hypothetical protein